MGKFIDLTGQRFGKWAVLERASNDKNSNPMWLCRCICGRTEMVLGYSLRGGVSRRCVYCRNKENPTKHGQQGTRLYSVWQGMIRRCENLNHEAYKYYGGRGISVYPEWRKDFKIFMDWAQANGYKEGLSIDRIDNNGNYGPGNCRFVAAKEQSRNRRSNRPIKIGNETKLLIEWAEQAGIDKLTLRYRIESGWPEHRLLEPVNK